MRIESEKQELSTLKSKPFVRKSSSIIGLQKQNNMKLDSGLSVDTPKWK